jgi:hypothetical protein
MQVNSIGSISINVKNDRSGKVEASENEGRPINYFKIENGTRPIYDYELPK